jgi:hypothetical protein
MGRQEYRSHVKARIKGDHIKALTEKVWICGASSASANLDQSQALSAGFAYGINLQQGSLSDSDRDRFGNIPGNAWRGSFTNPHSPFIRPPNAFIQRSA